MNIHINIALYPGDNLIANQLAQTNQHLNSMFGGQFTSVNDLSTFTKWDTATAAQSISTFDGNALSWDNDFIWSIYDAGVFKLTGPSMMLTIVGEVPVQYMPGDFGGSLYVPPQRDPGLYLLSQPVPALPYSNFTNIVGRLPREGEFVARLDGLTQMYTTNSFDGFSWSQGEPQLNVGEAAFFNLVEVPEPSSIAIICIGVVGLWCGRRRS